MRTPSTRGALAISALVLAAFAVGQLTTSTEVRLDADASSSQPQGRGVPETIPPSPVPTVAGETPLVYESGGGQSASANGFIAVTGSYGVGTSVLYVLDTESRQLAVYEARGGSPGSRRLVLVGARRIDLDLQLQGYNDKSEFSFGELQRRFDRQAGVAPTTDGSVGGASGKETGSEDPKK